MTDDQVECSDCGKMVPRGEHAAVWQQTRTGLIVRFVCAECSKKYEDVTKKTVGS